MRYTVATAATMGLAFTAPALSKSVPRDLPERRTMMFRPQSSYDQADGSSYGSQGGYSSQGTPMTQSQSSSAYIAWMNAGNGAPTIPMSPPANMPSTGTAAAAATTHTVTVGGSIGLVYTPDTIQANMGDMIVFNFESKNHTVTQSTFPAPCSPMAGGMDSGFVPNKDNSIVPAPQVAMKVVTTTPLWFFCAQEGHCSKGMVFSVNPTKAKSQASFKATAMGSSGSAGSAAAAPASSQSSSAPSASDSQTAGDMASGSAAPASGSGGSAGGSTGGITSGTGQIVEGSCVCSVMCPVGSFPDPSQGIGAFGGQPGSLPASAAMSGY